MNFLLSFSKNYSSSLAFFLPTYHYKLDGQLFLTVLGWECTQILFSYFNE